MPGLRKRTLSVLVVSAVILGIAAGTVLVGGAGAHPGTGERAHPGHARGHGFPPNVDRVDLSGYKIEAQYTLGRNTGNTFQQTYMAGGKVQGVPVAGPSVGMTFPVVDYVALPIARHTVYIVWQDPATHAIVDAFVMNFKTGVVFDYAPGSAQPESSGTVRILQAGANPIP